MFWTTAICCNRIKSRKPIQLYPDNINQYVAQDTSILRGKTSWLGWPNRRRPTEGRCTGCLGTIHQIYGRYPLVNRPGTMENDQWANIFRKNIGNHPLMVDFPFPCHQMTHDPQVDPKVVQMTSTMADGKIQSHQLTGYGSLFAFLLKWPSKSSNEAQDFWTIKNWLMLKRS